MTVDSGEFAASAVDRQLAYWREALAGLEPLDLPTDRPRPAVRSGRGASFEFEVPGEVAQELRELARREDCTLFTALLGVFQVLLSTYAGQSDVAVGVPGTGLNNLVMRADLSGDPTVRELLGQVRDRARCAYGNQDVPFERLVEELAPERDLSRTPLFQVMFAPQDDGPGEGLHVEPELLKAGTAHLDLMVSVREDADGIAVRVVYSTDLFDRVTVERLAGHFVTLLTSAAAGPDLRVGELELLTAAEREQLLVEWNDTATPFPVDLGVPELFEDRVRECPRAVALITGEDCLSYEELNVRANRLARHLKGLGVGPGTLVAVCLERGPQMVTALLAVLKAGGAYVPLDPQYPLDRLTFMLHDTAAPVIVTQENLRDSLPDSGAVVVSVDGEVDAAAIAGELDADLPSEASGGDLAYVIYTSGSTGQPKGVGIPRSALTNLLLGLRDRLTFTAKDRLLSVTTIMFDISNLELYLPLITGARVVLADREQARDPHALAALLTEQRITVMQATPSVWQMLVDVLPEQAAHLHVLTGGEALPLDLAQRLTRKARRVTNLYGPTETTIWSLAADVTPDADTVTIGSPIANTELFVMDHFHRLAPIGVPGELWIGGAGIARGYLNQPELTTERFPTHPHTPEARVYRTGDLVRRLPDGTIEYLRRIDHQVKIRGHRIELGEIETALLQHQAIETTAVIAREDTPGIKRLVAYYVTGRRAGAGSGPDVTELRAWCTQHLPEYMVPSAFVALDQLPLTANKKIDRKALPAPDTDRPDLGARYVAPRTPAEQVVARVWSDVLGIDRIGIHDNFFELGGDSLLVMRVANRVSRDLGVDLAVGDLFASPSVAALAERVEELSGSATRVLGPRGPEDREAPLSFGQQRLWFLHRLTPDSGQLLTHRVVRLRGAVDGPALDAAFTGLLRRHEVLRTRIVLDGDQEPRQLVVPAKTFTVERRVAAGRDEALRLLREEARKPLDPEDGPLLRAVLVREADDSHLLLVVVHHIASDDWSASILAGEVGELYAAAVEGRSPALPELPVQYADFAVWERDSHRSPLLERQLDYWRIRLDGLEPLELPTDRQRPPQRTGAGASVEFAVPAEVSDGLRRLARRVGVTPFMAFLAVFQLHLAKYTGQDDVAVGVPAAGRNRVETEGLIGFFVNTLVMRADLSGDPTFEEFLGRVRESAHGAYAHQDVPFERLVESIAPERDLSRTPLFQAMLTPQNLTDEVWDLPGLESEPLNTGMDGAQFDLTLVLRESADTFQGLLSYSTDLFEPATAERMARHFQTLLAGVVDAPEAPLSALDMLTEADRHQLLVEWNDTDRPLTVDSVPVLFEKQAAATPDAPAVIHEDIELSYRELNRRANRIAHRLIATGAGPGGVVALALPKSVDLIAALLGVAKTGAAYLPIDVQFPADRIAYMIEDARPACVLTDTTVQDALPAGPLRIVLDDPDCRTALAAGPDTDPDDTDRLGPLTQDTPFYVMYTSGSTGRPKGVVMPGAGLVNLTSWLRAATPGEPDGRIAQLATISFDIAPYEILSALLYGKCLVVAPESVRIDPVGLIRWLERHRVHELNAPNLVLEEFYKAANASGAVLRELRVIAQGGDTHVLGDAARTFHTRHPWCALHNGYGPTETHGVTDHVLPADVGQWPGVAPIGRPVGNTRLYVLDAHRRLVPPGVAGELYAAGVGLAHGYLRRPDLTDERFVPDPYGPQGTRMYRTGDLVRWLPDGTLDFLGRIDHQVKVRGIRIELGEVESALMAHADMASCVVVVREDTPGVKRLVAYCVTGQGSGSGGSGDGPDVSELRAWCARSLPEYMVPSAFVLLDRLPLTANKKVDRKALPAPDTDRPELGARYTAPRTPAEQVVARVWAGVLGVDRVGIHDNFFELGGHSLLAMRVVNGLGSKLDVDVPVRDLFAHPTVAGLAGHMAGLAPRTGSTPLVPRAAGTVPPLSFGQQRLWFLDQLLTDSAEYLLPTVVRLRGSLDASALERALARLVERHEVLRTRFVAGPDGDPRQIVEEPGGFALTELDGGTDPLGVVRREAFRPMDLAAGPPLRAVLVRAAAGEHLLLIVLHHIVSDGWSTRLVSEELPELYVAECERRPADLASLPVQYGDFAIWQREGLEGSAIDRQLAYWQQALAGLESLDLPTDRPRPAVRSGRGASFEFEVPGKVVEQLRELARREDCTLFMVLLGVFQVLLSTHAGQSDVAVGVPIAGRNRAETEGLVGFFVNNLVMRADLSGDPTVRELLGQVRDRALDAYGNQDVPFERLVEELAPERDLSRTPLFQVMFAPQDGPGEQWEFTGLDAEPVALEAVTAALDLMVMVREDAAGISARVEYSTDLFDRVTVERLAGHFVTLLTSAAAGPDLRVGELELLTAAERKQLLVEWNDTATPFPADLGVAELFEERVRECPRAVALISGEDCLSYEELNVRANRLARHLVGLGVGPGTLVAVCLERGPQMVTALLAVLKAGGAYVPLDPQYPLDRLTFMLHDTAAPVIVTQETLRDSLPDSGAVVVSVDGGLDAAAIGEQSDTDIAPEASGDDLAYVIYTSGSTGQPKGVGIPRSALTNLLVGLRDRLTFTAEDRLLSVTTIMFDISNLELYLPLITGARVVLADREQARDPHALAALLTEQRITVMQATPSVWQMLVDVLPEQAADLHILTGGEALPLDLAQRLTRKARRVTNLYGPTETTIWSLAADVTPDADTVTIGSPIANTELFVMDHFHRLAPIGVPGELWIGGAGIARGYLNQPELTTERFPTHPHTPDARVYRTGDLVRRLPDGTIEYLRRIDHQVKIRGHRIELGEIETALLQHQAIETTAVIAREDTPGIKRLVAYYVTGQDAENGPDVTELRAWCTRSLPEYMVPSAFVLLDQLPLTANKKVDRKALPAPDTDRPDLGEHYTAPRTPAECVVARVWSDVLGIDRIGIHDNFFELGGDSILSIQVIARARRFGLDLTPPMMFRYPTVEELSAHARPDTGEAFVESAPLPPTAYQRALLNAADDEGRGTNARLIATPALDPGLLRRALAAVIGHHDALRLRFGSEEDGILMRVASEPTGDLQHHDLTGLTEEAGRAEIAAHCRALRAGLDPSSGPLLHGAVFDVGQHRARHLLLVAHRLAVDEESWPILLADLDLAYQALAAGRDVVLPLKSTPFTAWAALHADDTSTRSFTATARVRTQVEHAETGSLTTGTTDEQHARLTEVTLGELESAVHAWGDGPARVELAVSGRERPRDGMDLTRTVGCLSLPAGHQNDHRPTMVLTVVQPPGHPPTGLGENVQLGAAEGESAVSAGARVHPVEVSVGLQDGVLSIELAYAVDAYAGSSIEALARSLRTRVTHRLNENSGASRSSVSVNSFPLAGLDEAGLASVLERFAK